jgi:gastric intrinsic factor
LSNAREPSDGDSHLETISDLEDMLSVKEMEVEIMIMLDKHRATSKPLTYERVARYILSLGSLCKDPRRFYGHDLVALLQHHESQSQDHEFALATLAACSSATHVRKKQIRRLLDIASGEITNVGKMGLHISLKLNCIFSNIS